MIAVSMSVTSATAAAMLLGLSRQVGGAPVAPVWPAGHILIDVINECKFDG